MLKCLPFVSVFSIHDILSLSLIWLKRMRIVSTVMALISWSRTIVFSEASASCHRFFLRRTKEKVWRYERELNHGVDFLLHVFLLLQRKPLWFGIELHCWCFKQVHFFMSTVVIVTWPCVDFMKSELCLIFANFNCGHPLLPSVGHLLFKTR